MARTRANNYDDKRRAILNHSAELFAEHGYDRASMSRIAEACGVSKANLYHYYKDKDELLFDVIRCHLEKLLHVVEAADRPDAPPQQRLHLLVGALLEAYRDADNQHSVQIGSLRLLSKARQTKLKNMERDLVRVFSSAVLGIAPQLRDTTMLMPATMSLFGMVNWHYLWFRDNGPFTRANYVDLVTRIMVDGTRNLSAAHTSAPDCATTRAPKSTASKRAAS